MANVQDFLEMWLGSQTIHSTQKKFRAQNRELTTVGYILDTEEIVKVSTSLFQHDGAAACTLSATSPLPPAFSAKELPGRQTQILNVCRMRRINRHPVKSDEDSAPERISVTDDCLNRNGDLDSPTEREDDCAADDKSDTLKDNCMEDPECPEQLVVNAAPNVPGLVQPTQKSKKQSEMVLLAVNAVQMRRNTGGKKMQVTMRQWFSSLM
jgi:hypothetical protein